LSRLLPNDPPDSSTALLFKNHLFPGEVLSITGRNQYERREERGAIAPAKGAKVLGEWSVIGGGKVFMLVDVEDPKAGYAVALA